MHRSCHGFAAGVTKQGALKCADVHVERPTGGGRAIVGWIAADKHHRRTRVTPGPRVWRRDHNSCVQTCVGLTPVRGVSSCFNCLPGTSSWLDVGTTSA